MSHEEEMEKQVAPIIAEMNRRREAIVASFPREEIFTIKVPVVLPKMTDEEKEKAFSELERAFLTANTVARLATNQMDALIALQGDPPHRLTLFDPDLRKKA